MATFLTTKKMSPALAARVEASVRGRRSPTGRRAPSLVATARLVALVAVTVVVGIVATRWQHVRSEEDRSREALLVDIEREAAELSPREHQIVSRVEALLLEASQADADAAEIRKEGDFSALLATPMVYVRGGRDALGDPDRMREAVKASVKDTFVLCLLDPPAQDSEKALLAKVMVAYSGGLEQRTGHARRLQSAAEGLPFLSRAFMKQVEEAPSLLALGKLRTAFDHAPLARAQEAARAEHLLYVLDEAPEAGAAVELDGASRHHVSVGFVHIASGRPLFRTRALMDPAWVSDRNRAEMGRGLTGCKLAFDVRAKMAPGP